MIQVSRRCDERLALNRTELNPDPNNLPVLDPKDALLVAESSTSVNGLKASSSSSNVHNVPWLRKTEYISRETNRPTHVPELSVFNSDSAAVVVDNLVAASKV